MVAEARVRGAAGATVTPDAAHITIDVSTVVAKASDALADVGRRVGVVEGILRDAQIADSDWRTARAAVTPEYDWRNNTRVLLGRRAQAHFVVTVREPSVINEIIDAAVADADAVIGGPHWVVEPDNPGRLEAYRAAAIDARSHAEAYASALGCRLGAVMRIDDVGDASPLPAPGTARMMAAPAGAAPEALHVGDVPIEAMVIVTFALEPVP